MTLRIPPAEIVEHSTSQLLGSHPTWRRVRLGDVADVLNGFAFKSRFFTKQSGVPLLRIRDVGRATTEAWYDGEFEDRYLVEHGAVVVGMDGDFRVARWRGGKALLNQRVCKLTIRDVGVYDEGFLYYVLPGYLDAVHSVTSSVTVKHLSSRTILDLPIPLPPLAEQQRIVAAIDEEFSRLDSADGSLANIVDRLRALREALYQPITGWDGPTFALAEIAHTASGGTPSRRHPDYFRGTIPWVKSGELRDGRVASTQESITELALRESSAKLLQPGTLLIALYGATVGKLAFLDIQAATNQAVCAITPHDPDLTSFLWHVLRAKRSQLIASAQGGAQPNISQAILRALPIPAPSASERFEIVANIEQQLSLIDSLGAAVESAQKRSAALRRAILERAFLGELVPQDPDDEPASVLLERIRAERAAAPKASGRRRVTA